MEENPRRVSEGLGGGPRCRRSCAAEHSSHHHPDGGGDPAGRKCCGKKCRSWAAGLIADCVALCCCPCAVVSFLTLALVKVPWKMGRKCLGGRKKRRKTPRKWQKKEDHGGEDYDDYGDGKEEEEEENEKGNDATSFGVEAERVWLELYQIGHLGFGRVSFTEIQ